MNSATDFYLALLTSSQMIYDSDNDWAMNTFNKEQEKRETKMVCQHGSACDWSNKVHLSEASHKTCKAFARNQQDNQGWLQPFRKEKKGS